MRAMYVGVGCVLRSYPAAQPRRASRRLAHSLGLGLGGGLRTRGGGGCAAESRRDTELSEIRAEKLRERAFGELR